MPKRYWYTLLAYLLMHLSGIVAAPFMKFRLGLSDDEILAYWNIIAFTGATIIILYLLREDMMMKSRSGAANFIQVVGWTVLGIILAYVSQYIAVFIETFVLGIKPGSENTFGIMDLIRQFPLFIFIPTILAPILEEVVFRKIIFGALYKRMNFFFAALISSFIFGIIHGEPQHILIYSSMGFVFAFLYVKTKRIIVPILTHAAMNSITVILQLSIDPEEIERLRRQLEEMMIIFG